MRSRRWLGLSARPPHLKWNPTGMAPITPLAKAEAASPQVPLSVGRFLVPSVTSRPSPCACDHLHSSSGAEAHEAETGEAAVHPGPVPSVSGRHHRRCERPHPARSFAEQDCFTGQPRECRSGDVVDQDSGGREIAATEVLRERPSRRPVMSSPTVTCKGSTVASGSWKWRTRAAGSF
jgi:hypothetical protein